MPAFSKYTLSFVDAFGRDVLVALWSGEFVLTPKALMADADPVKISFLGEEDDVFQSVITTKAEVRIVLGEDDLDIFEDLSSMTEETFGMTISIGDNYEWHGWVIPDEQEKKFSYSAQTITIRAIDPLSKIKGRKLLNDDKTYIHGEHTLKYYIEKCMDPLFGTDNTNGSYEFFIASTLRLSYDTVTVFPDILEQLTVFAEVFNDDMGRPINAYDVIKIIAEALCMRCFYENRKLYFVDVKTFTNNWEIGAIPLIYKTEGFEDNILLKNSENITTTRTFRESRVRFEYNGIVGLLEDGYLLNWTASGSGHVLTNWEYHPDLIAQGAAYYEHRRVGTGRQESPYGINLQNRYAYPAPGFPAQSYDRIAGKTTSNVSSFETLKISVKLEILNPMLIPHINGSATEYNFYTPVYVFIYNDGDPTKSYYISERQEDGFMQWNLVDLTGTSFASGSLDWTIFDFLLGSGLPAGFILSPERNYDKQTIDKDLAPIPESLSGDVFVVISPLRVWNQHFGGQRLADPASTHINVFEVLVSKAPRKLEKKATKGEITYLTRDIVTSKEYYERNISLNTTVNSGVAGSLNTTISYTRTSDSVVVPAGIVTGIESSPTSGRFSLREYNAIIQMNYNFTQYKIDLEAKSRNLQFNKFIGMSVFYDPERPSTEIYEEPFIQTKHEYDVKRGERKLTIISMKDNPRTISLDTLDETNDLLENYYIT